MQILHCRSFDEVRFWYYLNLPHTWLSDYDLICPEFEIAVDMIIQKREIVIFKVLSSHESNIIDI